MNPQQALEILDGVASKVSMQRREHEIVAEAVAVLVKLINEASDGGDVVQLKNEGEG